MTTDGRPPQANKTPAADNAPTDPPVYREAATPEEVEDAQEDEQGTGS
jgi:hypothetical protein